MDDAPATTRRALRNPKPTAPNASDPHGLTEMLTAAPEPLTPTQIASEALAPEPLSPAPPVTTDVAVAARAHTKAPKAPKAPKEPKQAKEPQAPKAAPKSPKAPIRAAKTAEPRVAFAWVDETSVALAPTATRTLDAAASPYLPVGADLIGTPPRRAPWRPSVVVPTLLVALVLAAYAATTLLWPLHAIPPTVEAVQVDPVVVPPAALTWPGSGSASVAVSGIGAPLASNGEVIPIASVTKVVTALVVLDEMPLAVGEQGPEFRFTSRDRSDYWDYRDNGESALDVPVGGTLTQLQLLQGMLIGSANNYANRLADNLWPNDAVFAQAANAWLQSHGVSGVTITDPSGIEFGNTATAESLIPLAKLALANPVIAQIVAMPSVELPGAGLVENTNGLLADPGVLGIKTGSLDSYNLLSAKQFVIGDTTVRVYAAVLGQPDSDSRFTVSRTLYAEIEAGLQPVPSVTQGTVTGHVTTAWGETVDVVTAADATVILWNGGTGAVTTNFSLGDALTKGTDVGNLTVQGPLNSSTTALELAGDVEPPTAWWRLTHPLELLGIT